MKVPPLSTNCVCLVASLLIGYLGLLPKVEAVSPAPDGGYPGENTVEGTSALLHLNGGTFNTALGWSSLGFDVTGNLNTGVGAATPLNNIADQNTATGAAALLSNTTGDLNTAVGSGALGINTTGNLNIALGELAGDGVTTAGNVICIGTNGNNVDNSCYIGNVFNATSAERTAVYVNTNGRLGTSTSSRRFKEDI